jgi:lysophospholipase L1-like esterase
MSDNAPVRTHRLFPATIALVVALVAGSGLTACEPPPDTYVALGDSYVSGPLIPTQRTDPAGCLRSTANYPSRVAPRLSTTRFVDVSCSGAYTTDLFHAQGVGGGQVNPPQLNALDRRTRVVTLGIGGNDIHVTSVVANCLGATAGSGGCRAVYTAGGIDELRRRIAALAPNLDRALAEIKRRAPRASVFVVGYPTVFPATGDGCHPTVPILPGDVDYLRGVLADLNAVLRDRATATGATYVDVATPSIGHDLCQAPERRWIEGLSPAAPAAPFHPNAAGMRATADVVFRHVAPTGTAWSVQR